MFINFRAGSNFQPIFRTVDRLNMSKLSLLPETCLAMVEDEPRVYGLLRATGIVYQLEEPETTIGRSEDCSIPLEGRGVSKLHARLCLVMERHVVCTCLHSGNPLCIL